MSRKNMTRRHVLSSALASYCVAQPALAKKSKSEKDDKKRKKKRDKKESKREDDPAPAPEVTASSSNSDGDSTPFRFQPFSVPLPLPKVKKPRAVGQAPFEPGDVFHGIAPEFFDRRVAEQPALNWYEEFPTAYYEMEMRRSFGEIIPGVRTPLCTYDGVYPGLTFKARIGQPVVVRVRNRLNVEMSVHLHGGHTPAHSDGYPNFYVLPGRARDYFYPNTVPMHDGEPDFTESPSSMWYHDHAMDITAEHVWLGMAVFYLTTDRLEEDLIASNVLPAPKYDIPLVLQDRRFNRDGTLFFDPLEHDGTLGDVWVANGKAQPYFKVERRKYRFRILNGCNARHLELELSEQLPFIGLGKDSWLYPNAIDRKTLLLAPANRADVVIDFTDAPPEVFLNNILEQDDGRGPDGDLDDPKRNRPGAPFVKFVVEGKAPAKKNAKVKVGTALRPHRPITKREIVRTRRFEFHRRKGAWQINDKFYDPDIANATPQLGTAERWILENGGGGWWHPIHIHLESHQIVKLNGTKPPIENQFKSDTVMLDGGGKAEVFMKFRTFPGPFVFHCHNLGHEDMRMMFTMDPRVEKTKSPQRIQSRFF